MRDKHIGMIPYYRRKTKTGHIRVFFRDVSGRKWGHIEVDDKTAATIKAGKSHTLEFDRE